MIKVPQQQIPGVYHRRVGDIVVTAISDGYLDGTLDVLRNIAQDEARKILAENFRPARRTAVNAFLVYSAGRLALIETGLGQLPAADGRQGAGQRQGGRRRSCQHRDGAAHAHASRPFRGPHRHGDGKPNYPNAELVMHENEPKHWFDDATMASGNGAGEEALLPGRARADAPYKNRWRLFQQGEVFPGVTAIPRHGHTPGHTTFMISSGKEQLLIWGDTVHVPEVQTARPEVCMEFDTDNDAAAASRRKVFDMVATDRLLVTGMHLHFPGFSHLVRRGSAYQLIPAAWEQAL